MINVSDNFKETLENGGRLYEVVEAEFTDGTVLTFNDEIMQGENTIVDGAGSSSFPIGAAVEKYITLCIDNREEQYASMDFFGAKLTVSLRLDLEDGTTTTIGKGTYTVTTPESYGEIIDITAVDDMYKADKTYETSYTLPQSLGLLVIEACEKCDIPMGDSVTGMTNGSLVIEEVPEELTFRTFLGYAAMINCANARIDTDGYLQFIKWGSINDQDSISDYHTLKDFSSSPTVSSDDIVITGVKLKNSTSEYQYGGDGYVLELENQILPDSSLESIAQYIGNSLINSAFRNMSGDLYADPTIEFGDMAYSYKYVPGLGEERCYFTPITDVSFTLNGYTTVQTQADDPVRGSSSYYSASAAAVIAARKLVEKEQTARELAVQDLEKALENSSGMYMTVEEQEDGSSIYYMHNLPSLDESDIIWKLTAEAFGISTDSGETYPYGFTVDGELITRLLYAEGINADYITTGALTVKDSDDNVTFSVNVDTGEAVFSGELSAASGTFGTITSGILQSENYEPGVSGILVDLTNGTIDCAALTTQIKNSSVHYCICDSEESSQIKIATCDDENISIEEGTVVIVKFTCANTYEHTFRLSVNSTIGYIRVNGAQVSTSNTFNWPAGATIVFTYDGTYWHAAEAGSYSYTRTLIEQTEESWSTTLEENYATIASLALTLEKDSTGNTYGALSAYASYIKFTGTQFVIDADNFSIDEDGNVSMTGDFYTTNSGDSTSTYQSASLTNSQLKFYWGINPTATDKLIGGIEMYTSGDSVNGYPYCIGTTVYGTDNYVDTQYFSYVGLGKGSRPLNTGVALFTGSNSTATNSYNFGLNTTEYYTPTIGSMTTAPFQVFCGMWARGTMLGSSGTAITSDLNAKEEITELDEALAIPFLEKLGTYTFKYKDGNSGRKHWGMISQYVKETMDECGVDSNDFGGYVQDNDEYFLRYDEFIAPLIKGWQSNRAKIEALESSLSEALKQLSTLQAQAEAM